MSLMSLMPLMPLNSLTAGISASTDFTVFTAFAHVNEITDFHAVNNFEKADVNFDFVQATRADRALSIL